VTRLSPFPVREALNEARQQASQGWRKWFLDVYTAINELLTGAESTASRLASLETIGAWREVAFNAADFSADVGTWTVDVLDVASNRYVRLGEHTALWSVRLTTTDVAGGPAGYLSIALPAGLAAAATTSVRAAFASDNGTEVDALVECIGSEVRITNRTTGTWANSAGGTWLYVVIPLELA
jgi:hypothetical protein